jgi:cyanuric acid amidohydrolase
MTALVHRLSARGPDDVTPLLAAIEAGQIHANGIVAILGKTEGNGCVNDFTRAYAVRELRRALAEHLPETQVDGVSIVMSGGTEGALAPHWLVLERRQAETGMGPALAIGSVHTGDLAPEDLGRRAQVVMVAEGVRKAMADAGIDKADDVHFVQIKCPLLTAERIEAAAERGATTVTRDALKSMGFSRGASALGVAVALGELDIDDSDDDAICRDFELWSGRASTSAGVELLNHEIVVLGMSARWSGPLAIDHAVMSDSIDVTPVRAALDRCGLNDAGQIEADRRGRVVALLAKAEAGSTGRLRGYRHTMLDDSDISSTRHARAFVGGVLAGLIGHAEIFVSGGAEHQGPDGGGPVAIIARREISP